jgi:hypothetical protein
MPRRLGCALLLFLTSVWVLTQPFTEQGGIGRMLQLGCDHLVTAIFTSTEIQDTEGIESGRWLTCPSEIPASGAT